jgi:hypothetical protein
MRLDPRKLSSQVESATPLQRGLKFPLTRIVLAMVFLTPAIVLVGAAFGAVHLVHAEATGLSAVAIAVQDIILSGAFVLTRRVWLGWGIHWGWNFVQDGVLGMPNSSVDDLPSLINPEVIGPTWLTGGSFGIELSAPFGAMLQKLWKSMTTAWW